MSLTRDDILAMLDHEILAAHLLAEAGCRTGLYAYGEGYRISTGPDVGMEIADRNRPICDVPVPGVDHLDDSWWLDGCLPGTTLKDAVRAGCRDGNVEDYYEELATALYEALRISRIPHMEPWGKEGDTFPMLYVDAAAMLVDVVVLPWHTCGAVGSNWQHCSSVEEASREMVALLAAGYRRGSDRAPAF